MLDMKMQNVQIVHLISKLSWCSRGLTLSKRLPDVVQVNTVKLLTTLCVS